MTPISIFEVSFWWSIPCQLCLGRRSWVGRYPKASKLRVVMREKRWRLSLHLYVFDLKSSCSRTNQTQKLQLNTISIPILAFFHWNPVFPIDGITSIICCLLWDLFAEDKWPEQRVGFPFSFLMDLSRLLMGLTN